MSSDPTSMRLQKKFSYYRQCKFHWFLSKHRYVGLLVSLLQVFLEPLRSYLSLLFGLPVDDHGPKGFEGEAPPLPELRMGSGPKKPAA